MIKESMAIANNANADLNRMERELKNPLRMRKTWVKPRRSGESQIKQADLRSLVNPKVSELPWGLCCCSSRAATIKLGRR